MSYELKYLKYKNKYLKLKNIQLGGSLASDTASAAGTTIHDSKKTEATLKYNNGEYIEAIKLYEEACLLLTDYKTNEENKKKYSICKSNMAECCLKISDYNNAYMFATQSILVDPLYKKPYQKRARACIELSRFNKALLDLNELDKTKEILTFIERCTSSLESLFNDIFIDTNCKTLCSQNSRLVLYVINTYKFKISNVISMEHFQLLFELIKQKYSYVGIVEGPLISNLIRSIIPDSLVVDIESRIIRLIHELFPVCEDPIIMLNYLLNNIKPVKLEAIRNRQYGYNFPRLTKFYEDIIRYARGKHVLELGTGNGFFAFQLLAGGAGFVETHEINPDSCEKCLPLFRLFIENQCKTLDVRQLRIINDDISLLENRFTIDSCECVTMFNVLHYMSPTQIKNTLFKISQVLTQSGRLFVNFDSPIASPAIFEKYKENKQNKVPFPGFLKYHLHKKTKIISSIVNANIHTDHPANITDIGDNLEYGYHGLDIDTIQSLLAEFSLIIVTGHITDSVGTCHPIEKMNDTWIEKFITQFPGSQSLRICLEIKKSDILL